MITQRYLRYVGKDCLVAFDANLYSVPAGKVRPRQLVEVRATKSQIIRHHSPHHRRHSPRDVSQGRRPRSLRRRQEVMELLDPVVRAPGERRPTR
ncbi:Mu transposase domain-containing protein [Streptomyces sp. NPDC085614]|uniref:Mu transposase domain-containing protein n=1 Tax=Streptomyces sp. NPDC085614 TaxID=3365733 RepID=UPI0037D24C37